MCRHATHRLAPEPSSALTARDLLRGYFTDWGLLAVLYDAQLACSELVSNAVLHGRPPLTLAVSSENATVEIAVYDGNATLPEPRAARADLAGDLTALLATQAGQDTSLDERDPRVHIGDAGSVTGGRGLLLVAALAAQWGVSALSDGKAVWIRTPAPPSWPHADSCPCSNSPNAVTLASGRPAVHRA